MSNLGLIDKKIIDGAHGLRLEFDAAPNGRPAHAELVPNHFLAKWKIADASLRARCPFDRIVPYRRFVFCPRFTLNLSTS